MSFNLTKTMFNCFIKDKQKGAIAILIAVVMLLVVLFIALTVSSIIAASQQSSSRLSDSTRAYQAADSGLEYGLKIFTEFLKNNPFVKQMTAEDFYQECDSRECDNINSEDNFCSGNDPKWVTVAGPSGKNLVEFCLEPKVDVLGNIYVMQAIGKSGLTRRAIGVRLPVAKTVACFVREGCATYGNDGTGSETGTKCKLNRSGTVDPLFPEYENAQPYSEEDICCNSTADCDRIAGGIDFGSYASGDLIDVNKQSAFVIEGYWHNPDKKMTSVNGGPSADAWKTDKDHFITIFTRGQARHDGIYGHKAGAYRVENPGWIPVFWVSVAAVKIDGIQIKLNNHPNNHAFLFENTGFSQVSNNIIKGANRPDQKGIWIKPGSDNNRIYNNIIYNFQHNNPNTVAIHIQGTNNMVYNNTIYNAKTGIKTINNQTKLINNIVSQCQTPFDGVFQVANYNTWDMGTPPLGAGANNIDARPVVQPPAPAPPLPPNPNEIVFQNPAIENFLLKATATAAKNMGWNLSPENPDDGIGLYFRKDIQGEDRPAWNTSWDIGADEIP